ncbi:MAG TPA: hypothetical protein VF188_11735 [Longimicrobiales bacterium]
MKLREVFRFELAYQVRRVCATSAISPMPPIGNEYAIFSADYAVHEGRWNGLPADSGQGVAIRIYHPPGHSASLERMLRSVRASLDLLDREEREDDDNIDGMGIGGRRRPPHPDRPRRERNR